MILTLLGSIKFKENHEDLIPIEFHAVNTLKNDQIILKVYQQADWKRRCDMWFMYRHMRKEFDELSNISEKVNVVNANEADIVAKVTGDEKYDKL